MSSTGIYYDLLAKMGAGSAHPGGFAITLELVESLNLAPKTKVLDLGCGTGRTACYIASQFGCDVTGLDIHPLMIEKAKKRAERTGCSASFLEGNALSTSFGADTFDVVLSESVAVFLPVETLLSECYRILKPGGHVVGLEFYAPRSLSQEVLNAAAGVYGVKQLPTLKEWERHYTSCGFSDVRLWNPRAADWGTFFKNEGKFPDDEQIISDDIFLDPKYMEVAVQNVHFMERYCRKLGFTGIIARK